MRLLRILMIPIFTLAIPGQAATPPPQILLETIYVKPIKHVEKEIKKEQVSKVIPLNLQPGQEDEKSVSAKIMDHSIQSFTQGDLFQSSDLGRAAKSVESTFKKDIVLGSSPDGSVAHKVNMQLLAFQGVAKVEYRGLLSVDMVMGSAGFEMSINEKLNSSTDLKLKHASQDSASTAYVVWAW